MKLKESLIINQIDGKYVLVDGDLEDTRFNGLIKTNETGKDIIEMLMKGVDNTDQIVKQMMAIYDVSEDKLNKDINTIIIELKKANLMQN